MTERDIRLLVDEDVWVGLAAVLRQAGYDVVSMAEAQRKGLSDEDQLAFAISEQWVIITHTLAVRRRGGACRSPS